MFAASRCRCRQQSRVPNPGVIAVRVANLEERDRLLAAHPKKFFTEPHYEGYPAVLVRLDAVRVADLKPLIADAWRTRASVDLLKQFPAAASRPAVNRHS